MNIMDIAVSLLRRLPILGWFIADAQSGSDTSKILFFVNILICWILAIYFFGYAAFIITALSLVPIVFFSLISVTARDGF
jgi:hypothetical protein